MQRFFSVSPYVLWQPSHYLKVGPTFVGHRCRWWPVITALTVNTVFNNSNKLTAVIKIKIVIKDFVI